MAETRTGSESCDNPLQVLLQRPQPVSRPELVALLALSAAISSWSAGHAQEAPTSGERVVALKIVTVDCEAGESVSRALQEPGIDLEIQIVGVCDESVTVDRDRVILRGRDPLRDGLRSLASQDPRESALLINSARRVRVENLLLTGGAWAGLRVLGSHDQVEVTNCRLETNGQWGAVIVDSTVTLRDTVITDNGASASLVARGGMLVTRGSSAACIDCRIEANPAPGSGFGALAYSSSALTLTRSFAEGGTALMAQLHSSVSAIDTDLAASVWAFQANLYGDVFLRGGSYAGAFLATSHSTVQLFGATQTVNTSQNFVAEDSTLLADDRLTEDGTSVSSTILGLTLVTDFSSGKLIDNTVFDSLSCGMEGRVYCDGTETKIGTSGCGLCPP